MSTSNNSSDLLNIKGKKKTVVEDLISPRSIKKDSNDIFPSASMLNKTTPTPIGQNDILSRVQAFLPQLKAANEELEKLDPSKRDIENVDEEDEQYIEMNLGLGVYDLKKADQEDSDSSEDEEVVIPNSINNEKSSNPIIEILEDKK
ncbi:MAG: hypothetical protein EXX96DRAFT_534924 [Benjaminiella poitrasii]|nr:MAG: hypothetical protein EXX96DRAFT_534924 [Benjaminiella poitrasii]